MRWVATVWMSAALVVATTALHLTTVYDLQSDQTNPTALNTNTKQHIVHVVNDTRELGDPKQERPENVAENLVRYLNDPDSIYSLSETKESNSDESDSKSRSKTSETSEDKDIRSSVGSKSDDDDNGENGQGNGKPEETEPATTEEQSTTSTTEPVGPGEGEGDQGTTSPPGLDHTIVETSTGRVQGHWWHENKNIISYIDIKYGTYKNRFEAPVFPEAAEDHIHDKKSHTIRCPQLQGDTKDGVTDCLTLSIFKPSKDELSGASVLVHIHEGNFINESANPEIYGPEYLVSEEIILVLPNYRLGPLGFLCLQNGTARGNAALKDLALALRWVKDNIIHFGGDPENIAVSGEGTAGALAGYLALSPISKSSVSKVIIESGSVLSHWAIDRDPILTATNLATRIPGSWESWETIDMELLLLAARGIAWRPCVENQTENVAHFMVESPWTMLQEEENKVAFMIGSAEYAGVHESLTHTADSIAQLNANNGLLLPNDLTFGSSEEMTRVGTKVKALYFPEGEITLNNVKNRTLYYTDMAYLGPVLRTARSLVNSGSTVYLYEFSFVGDLNRELAAVENQAGGAVRGDTIGYLFYQEGDMSDVDDKTKIMMQQMIQLWVSFLNTGTPTADDIVWNKFEKGTAAQEQLLTLGEETEMATGVHAGRLALWTDIYDKHFIEKSLALAVSPAVYTVLILQAMFFITFFKNAGHFF